MTDPLNWTSLSSSNLDAFRYDPETSLLQIRFKSGKTYPYTNVPQAVVSDLENAASPGQYFNNNIKGRYE